MPLNVENLTLQIDEEVIRALGIPLDGWVAGRLHAALQQATRRFSELFAEVDGIIAEQGLPAGALRLLQTLAAGCDVRGAENIPGEGPLVIACNHPGAVDSLALTASARRLDLKIIASAVPFLESLPNVRRHLIFAPKPTHVEARMLAMRESIRHLRSGGAILLFEHGTIDPDPAIMPVDQHEFDGWSRSLEMFLRTVPQAQVVIGIVSGVIDPGCMRNPITWLRRARPDRQRLAMMIQIIQQMLGRHFEIIPHVSFGGCLEADRLGTLEQVRAAVVSQSQALMQGHMARPA